MEVMIAISGFLLFVGGYTIGRVDGARATEDRCMALLRKWNGVEK